VIDPGVQDVEAGALQSGAAGIRFVPGDLGHRGYAGPHRYRFHVLAIDEPVPDHVTTAKALLKKIGGHVLARGVLTGTFERP